jgi:hypothetical protein
MYTNRNLKGLVVLVIPLANEMKICAKKNGLPKIKIVALRHFNFTHIIILCIQVSDTNMLYALVELRVARVSRVFF